MDMEIYLSQNDSTFLLKIIDLKIYHVIMTSKLNKTGRGNNVKLFTVCFVFCHMLFVC